MSVFTGNFRPNLPGKFTTAYWFHGTCTSAHNIFDSGLLPLNKARLLVMDMLVNLAPDAVVKETLQAWNFPRSFRFEAWLAEFFSIFKLAPCSSSRNTGKQIDGSFRLNDNFYLLEAKWHQNRTSATDLHVFEGKLSTKAKWARGVFISWMGFTDEGLTAFWTQNSDMLRKQGSLMSSLTDFTPFP